MARAPKITDVERTAEMLDALRCARTVERAGAESAIVLTEVPAFSGYKQTNADALVLNLWQSAGRDRKTRTFRRLDGFELKASRGDLKRELANGEKNAAVRRFCNTWTLLAYDDKVLGDLVLPDSWGIAILRDGELVTKRRAPLLTPEPWSDSFITSLIRRAWHQSPGAAYVARACAAASEHGYHSGKHSGRSEARQELARVLGENVPRNPWGARDESWDSLLEAVAKMAHQEPFLAAASQVPDAETGANNG